MLRRSTQAIEKWKGFDEAIDRWLEERHQLIVQLTEFAADHKFDGKPAKIEEKLQSFNSLLIDYISAGHFEFYQRLIEEGKEFGDLAAVISTESLLESIQVSTEQALNFNGKYHGTCDLSQCASDLSSLAEALAVRFDAEDQMINTLHKAHMRQISA